MAQNEPKGKDRYMLVWPDGEYCYDEQYEENPEQPLGYMKSDDFIKVELEFGMNMVDLNGTTLVVERDYWGCVWERETHEVLY